MQTPAGPVTHPRSGTAQLARRAWVSRSVQSSSSRSAALLVMNEVMRCAFPRAGGVRWNGCRADLRRVRACRAHVRHSPAGVGAARRRIAAPAPAARAQQRHDGRAVPKKRIGRGPRPALLRGQRTRGTGLAGCAARVSRGSAEAGAAKAGPGAAPPASTSRQDRPRAPSAPAARERTRRRHDSCNTGRRAAVRCSQDSWQSPVCMLRPPVAPPHTIRVLCTAERSGRLPP